MNLQTLTHIAAASGGIIYIMAVLLLIALTLIIERTLYLMRTLREGQRLMQELDDQHGSIKAETLRSLQQSHAGLPHQRLLSVAAELCEKGSEHAETRFEEAIMRELPHVDRHLWMLDTIITLAPLLGLLGTIIGMFNAFAVLAHADNAPTQVTGGVAEALIATACGLFIAILGLVAFNGLNNRIRIIVHQLETVKMMLLNRVKMTRHEDASKHRPATREVA